MKDNFFATGTAREIRLAENIFIDSEVLKKKKGGSYDYKGNQISSKVARQQHRNSVLEFFKSSISPCRQTPLAKREKVYSSAKSISERYVEFGVGVGVVLEYAHALRKKWLDRKFHLPFDNFSTSIPLIEELMKDNIFAQLVQQEKYDWQEIYS
ncbi:hypothetical protein JTB14_000233 [Gonioctena quinquepunctata]|nr:hypothetical protein JTB14_000233 [Gonioctena quinquepunctata]